MEFDELSNKIIGCAIKVHRTLGPVLLESAYEGCLCYELAQAGIPFRRQVELPVQYETVKIDCGYRLDILVDDQVLVELKTVEKILPVHEAQLLSYLKLSRYKIGILLNFNVEILKDGIKRMVL